VSQTPDGLGKPPATPIVALPPIEALRPDLPIDPKTGEPPHALTVRLAYALWLAAAAAQAGGLAAAWWHAIHVKTFTRAIRLFAWWQVQPGTVTAIVLAIVMMAIGVALVAVPAITGYLGWVGRPAATKWAVAAVLATAATLLLTPDTWALIRSNVSWLAAPLSLAGAIMVWLPRSRANLAAWERFRHPVRPLDDAPKPVVYGRLEQFQ